MEPNKFYIKIEEICGNCACYEEFNCGWCSHKKYWGHYDVDESPCNGDGFIPNYDAEERIIKDVVEKTLKGVKICQKRKI